MRMQMIELKQHGLSTAQIAHQLQLSRSWVKKFWRRFRHEGQAGLQLRSCRPKTPPPHQTPVTVRQLIVQIKRAHPHWGGQFIQGELRRQHAPTIPHRRTIERWLSQFPELPKRRYQRWPTLPDPARATRLHQLWQMDFKVDYRFPSSRHRESFLNIRDMASTLAILTYTLPEGRTALSSQEVIGVCRQAFTHWGVLPEAIRTDHGACFCAPDSDSFPTDFTLYLWGLGIAHELIPVRRPSANGGIERDHRTLSENFLADYAFQSHPRLVRDAQAFGQFRNHFVPSRSLRCQGQTPVAVAQRLACHAVAYQPRWEAQLFDPQRIYEKLAPLPWQRTVSNSGYLTLGHHKYYAGRVYRHQVLHLRFERTTLEVVACMGQGQEVKRWPIRGLTYHEIVHNLTGAKKKKHSGSHQQAA
jgi:transposase InsO family protein